jgi:hypothetical protein
MEKPAPPTNVNNAAISAQTKLSLPCPNGCCSSAGLSPRRSATYRKTSVTVSASEWAASDSIAAEPDSMPATSLAAAITRLATPARITVPTLSSGPFAPGVSVSTSRGSAAARPTGV